MTGRDIDFNQFGRKPVISLPAEASVAESIRLMYRNQLRHVPITTNIDIIGVINPKCIINMISNESADIDFNINCEEIACQNYITVNPEVSLFDIVETISNDPNTVIMMKDNNQLDGIFTEIDILDIDFLWHNITDHPISVDDTLGVSIEYDQSTSLDHTIHQMIRVMDRLDQEYVLLKEDGEMRGIVDFLSVIHHIYYGTYRQARPLSSVLARSISSIFPSSGLWYKEPVLLSQVRREMYIHDVYHAIILDGQNIAKRVISSSDLISYLVENSDYYDESRI